MNEKVRRILYLEEGEDLVRYLPMLLQEKGLVVTGTTSVDDALAFFAEQDFDGVLLDIFLPPTDDMDAESLDYGRETGVEVARRMKALKPHVPIVALTVVTDPEIQEHMKAAGIVSTVNKPAEPDAIAEALWQVLRRFR